MSVIASATVRIDTQQDNVVPFGTASRKASFPAPAFAWASGVAAGQVDRQYVKTITLAASGTLSLDLAAGITDDFGASITFATVKAVAIYAHPDNTNTVDVTTPGSNGFPLFIAAGDGIKIPPGYASVPIIGLGAGRAVTPSTGDLLLFTNGGAGTGVTFDLMILGTSA